MKLCHLAAVQAALALACGGAPPLAAQELAPQTFEHLQRMIRPTAAESVWAEIPWMTSVSEARRKAAAEGKPLVVWTMSGEPLGMC